MVYELEKSSPTQFTITVRTPYTELKPLLPASVKTT